MFQSVMFDFGSFPDASPGRVDRWSGLPWPEPWSHGSGSGLKNVLAHGREDRLEGADFRGRCFPRFE